MKHLKYFESLDKSDIQFHVEQLTDLFMDVVDEFGLTGWEFGVDQTSTANGLFYFFNVNVNAKWIQIMILNIHDGRFLEINEIVKSKTIKDFEERIKSIGYVIENTKTSNGSNTYAIDISYKTY